MAASAQAQDPKCESKGHAFLSPSSARGFSPAAFAEFFKAAVRSATGADLSPGKLRHLFVTERMSPNAVPGPENSEIAQVMVRLLNQLFTLKH